jgi:hypothetical protein
VRSSGALCFVAPERLRRPDYHWPLTMKWGLSRMYVRDLLASSLRRWYLVLLGLLVTALLCALAHSAVPVSYSASGSMLLLPPSSSVGKRGNPYLYLGGLSQALEVLSARLNAESYRKPIESAHSQVVVQTAPDTSTTGPILLVTTVGPDAGETLGVTQEVMDAVPGALVGLQDSLSVPPASRITVMVLTPASSPTADAKTQTRALLALAGAGLAATILLTGLIDGALLGRSSRRRKGATPQVTGTDDLDWDWSAGSSDVLGQRVSQGEGWTGKQEPDVAWSPRAGMDRRAAADNLPPGLTQPESEASPDDDRVLGGWKS